MPYPNEHAARVRQPGDFKENSFKRKTIQTGIDIIMGKLKDGDGSMVTQAYRFDASKFTAQEAKDWLKEHKIKYISFEAAAKKEEKQMRKYGYEVKDIDQTKGIVTLYANAFNVLDSDNDISLPGSFKKTIKENFSRVKWFLNHDRTQLLGVPLEAKEDKFGLLVTGQLNLKKDIAKDILEDYILYNENGKTLEHSIGVSATKWEMLEDDAVPTEYRKRGIKSIRNVSEWKWWEYSTLTSWGANEQTPLVSIKDLQNIDLTIQWLEKMLTGNYSEQRLCQIEQLIEGLKSLSEEPNSAEEITQRGEPIDVNKLISNYSLFK